MSIDITPAPAGADATAPSPGDAATATTPAAPWTRLLLRDLGRIAEWQDEIPWRPFADGVEIHRLYGDGVGGPTAALLRYRDGGAVGLHEHAGYEHILVLSGAQHDEHGTVRAGSLAINAPGTRHRVLSESGCIVLAIYEKPVRFLEA